MFIFVEIKYNLIILGSGTEENNVRNMANSKTNVHYLGYQSKQNVLSLIHSSDLLIQPSLEEGISSTVLEEPSVCCKTMSECCAIYTATFLTIAIGGIVPVPSFTLLR